MSLFSRTPSSPAPSSLARLAAAKLGAAALIAIGLTAGCARDDFWDRPTEVPQVWSFPGAFIAHDPEASRLGVFTVDGALAVHSAFVPLDEDVVASAVAPPDAEGRRHLLLVTAARATPAGRRASTAPAHLTILDPASPSTPVVLPLSYPARGLAVDPRGEWAVLHAGSEASGFLVNPNELTLVALDPSALPPGTPQVQPHTLRSFGGTPRRFTFTDTLQLPAGPRRLLAVETDKDVALVNLRNLSEPDLTIQLTSGVGTRSLAPAGLIVSDGEPAANDDARIAIRLENDASIIVAQLGPAAGRDYDAPINVVDVGGPPSDMAFVRTDGGALALAALVPSRKAAVVVDPLTSVGVEVALPAAYERLALVTAEVNGSASAKDPDVALLWSVNNPSVSFWALGRTVGKPYRSLENVALATPLRAVLDLPPPHVDRKLLAGRNNNFFLLDLSARTVDPFFAATTETALRPGASGSWAWAFLPGSVGLARLDLATKHPDVLSVDQPIHELFEMATTGGEAQHALVALHKRGDLSVTVYDAAAQGEKLSVRHVTSGLLLRR